LVFPKSAQNTVSNGGLATGFAIKYEPKQGPVNALRQGARKVRVRSKVACSGKEFLLLLSLLSPAGVAARATK
jgi:hypothetical protein